jgi:hypothetical protein
MHYTDLSAYTNHLRDALVNVKNVGWLNGAEEFSSGTVEPHLLNRLKQAFVGVGKFDAEAVLIRGAQHRCEICGASPGVVEVGGKKKYLGASEIWIPAGRDVYYAAPSLVIHYIEEHQYLPPAEFIDAISSLDLGGEFSAEEAWRRSIIQI